MFVLRKGHPTRLLRVILTLLVAVLCVACAGQEITGRPQPTGAIDPSSVGGLPVTEGPSGTRPGVPDARLPVRNITSSSVDKLSVDTLADLSDFWAQELPRDFGKRFTPVRTLIAVDSADANIKICGQDSHGLTNALYCPAEDSIVWDHGTMLPALNRTLGPMGVVTVFAHEMGHVVQFRLGAVNQATETIVKEQQADCYTGAFIRWVAQDKAKHLRISTGDGLNEALAALMFVRDPIGTNAPDDASYGSSFDRITAFQLGFTAGAPRCAKIDYPETQRRIAELGFNREAHSDENLPVNDQTLGLLANSLNVVFKQRTANPPRIVDNGGHCPDGPGTPPASYCPSDNTIGIDVPTLSRLATPLSSAVGTGDASLGDFAAFAEIASRYALSVQKTLGLPLNDPNAGLRTACLTGAWAGLARHRVTDGADPEILLGPDDLGEAVAELLTSHSVVAADVNGHAVPSGFARVQAFQIGFLQGWAVCTTRFR